MAFTLNPLRMKLPVKLILIIVGVLFFGHYLSLDVKRFCFAISMSIKEVLEFVLPFIIFSYLSSCILSFKKGVLTFIVILLATVYISNFIAVQVGYGASLLVLEKINFATSADGKAVSEVLTPMWSWSFPKLLSNDWALYVGLISGLFFSFMRTFAQSQNIKFLEKLANGFERFTHYLKNASSFFLIRIFIPLVPFFILGYIISLQHAGTLGQIVTSYAPIFIFTVTVQALYGALLFLIVAHFKFNLWFEYIKNTIPAIIAGFSTMSSAAAMPLTLLAAEKNTGNPNMARVLIPATVNIHMIGNGLTITIMAMAFLLTFGMPFPDFPTVIFFGLSFALAQFAIAAVPGGGILVMLPLLQKYMHFTPEMTSIITALYVLFDAPLTATNIMGNSVYSIFLNKIFTKLKIGTD
ncbi:MAG: hypothetical protein C5B43_02935 [Verrucomicrobia bacterium]|nr:MAG: hypothetical protein C5B43_02935 [Verrucomicrobiota bacterium]